MAPYYWMACLLMQIFWCEAAEQKRRSTSSNGFCQQTAECISRIKKMVPDASRFWFGEQWKDNCIHQSVHRKSSIQCLNPKELSNYYSLGSRLFRVNTFIPAYLANLHVFPRIHFTSHSGSYRACDHNFSVDEEEAEIEVHPQTRPTPSFQLVQPPTIDWPQLRPNDSFILVFLDVGFGTLKGLAVDFPRATRFIHEYETFENFRLHQPTPLAVLVFSSLEHYVDWDQRFHYSKEALFDLPQFMMEFRLEKGLIGLNWFLVAGDAYSIERQRMKGLADNCHALIQIKLINDRRWSFVESFSLTSMDSSLSISAVQEHSNIFTACCTPITIEKGEVFADPLADKRFPSIMLLQPPKVTSLRSLETMVFDNYQRSYRHYVVLKEERYTLVMFDPVRSYLQWMIVDIPSESLASGNLEAENLVAPYIPPIPQTANTCLFAVFILFKQPANTILSNFYNSDHALKSKHCFDHCSYRVNFEIEQLASFHRLQLSGISWIEVCYDLLEASRQIQIIFQSNTNTTNLLAQQSFSHVNTTNNSLKRRLASSPKSKTELKKEIEKICMEMQLPEAEQYCSMEENSVLERSFNLYLVIISVSLWLFG